MSRSLVRSVNIYPGSFTKLGGSFDLSDETFEKTKLKISSYIGGRFEKRYQKIYSYRDMVMFADRNSQKVFIQKQTRAEFKNNLLLEMITEREVDREQFPTYDQYHNIVNQNSIIFRCGPNRRVSVAFMTEEYGEKKNNYVKISFEDLQDQEVKKYVDKLVSIIQEEIS